MLKSTRLVAATILTVGLAAGSLAASRMRAATSSETTISVAVAASVAVTTLVVMASMKSLQRNCVASSGR